jgi:SAM-dependent methyltransferase
VAATQEALYADIDLALSWSERQLPQRERTKHVHALHPYLGKFVPQLVEILLQRYFRRGDHVLDPFAGSGTTLIQSLESGCHATGVDIAAFNCLLMQVKTASYNAFVLERALRDACARLAAFRPGRPVEASPYVRRWYAPQAAEELLFWRGLVNDYDHADVLRVVLARAARSARRTTHFELDFPRRPQVGECWCHKHKRRCRPVEAARHFLLRYSTDTLARIRAFARVRSDVSARVLHGDSRTLAFEHRFDGVVTSPPYPGLIDYHEQHRYAYELLGLDDRRDDELGAAAAGTSRSAVERYCDGIAEALANAARALRPGAPVVIVVNDRRGLYPGILERAGLALEDRVRRHVNRRTGRRSGEFFEDVLVARRD